VNEEDSYDIHVVDYAERAITWSYSVPNTSPVTPLDASEREDEGLG